MSSEFLHEIPRDWRAHLAFGASRSAKPGEWKNTAVTVPNLIEGLTRHVIGEKDGRAFLQGETTAGTRTERAMSRLHIVGIDVDNGMPSADIDDIIRERGLFCIRYTTHSHGKDYTDVLADKWVKFQRANPDATIGDFLVADKRYLPEVAAQATQGKRTLQPTGMTLRVHHPRMDKNRLIFVLAKPWDVRDYETQAEALAAWRDAYKAFAAWLGIAIDKSCTDVSRLFYTPRRDKDAPFDAVVHQGAAVDIFAIPNAARPAPNPFLAAAALMGATVDDPGERAKAPLWLRTWAAKHAGDFLVADALAEHAPHVFRPEFDRDGSKRHIECPFEDEHSQPGGAATFVSNAGDTPGGGFSIHCRHNSCAERDRLDFLAKMVELEWLPVHALTDGAFLIGGGEAQEAEEDEDETPAQNYVREADVPQKIAALLPGDDMGWIKTPEDVERCAQAIAESGISPIVAASKLDKLCRHAALMEPPIPKAAVRKAFNAATRAEDAKRAEARRKAKEAEKLAARIRTEGLRQESVAKSDLPTVVYDSAEVSHTQASDTALEALVARNARQPTLFRSAGFLSRIARDEEGQPRIEHMDARSLRYEMDSVVRFLVDVKDGLKSIRAPSDVAEHILAIPEPPFPPLAGIVTAPVFGADRRINTKPGYDPSSRLFFDPVGGLTVPPIPETPSEKDVAEALDLLLGNALVDFPFDGPENAASEKAHALALVLQPFARQIIDGPTPIYLVMKPTPGTGASKLVNIYSLISSGEEAVAQTESRSEEEIRKRLTSALMDAAPTFYLDNINYKVDSSALASAVTSKYWTDRMLGRSQTVRVPVRHTWIFAGNNPKLSNEIARRCVRIYLDAKVERPELRTGFKHQNLEKWVRENRGRLVWACLTLIQNWVAKGEPEPRKTKGSFEVWARVMGGILTAANVPGFLENDNILREDADEEGSAVRHFLSAWWDRYQDQPATVGGGAVEGLFDLYKDESVPLPIQGNSPDSQKISLGRYIASLKGRVFTIDDDAGQPVRVRVEAAGKTLNKSRWQLSKIAA